jgi:UDP-N-acetylmuramoylalanine--D-glutamate ligase
VRTAIFGAGRSGIAAVKAAKALGWVPTLYDEKPESALDPAIRQAISDLGVNAVFDFSGNWHKEETDIVVTSPGVSKTHPKLLAAVESGIPVIGEVELAYRVAQAPIIAITGTNGKSTTTLMTFMALRHAGMDAKLCGNIYGSGYEEVPLTEAAIQSKPDQVLVAEISSFQLEWIDQLRPKAAIVTNITEDHLNRYASFDEYAATKMKIFANMGSGDTAVWHAGDGLTLPPEHEGLTQFSFGELGSDAYIADGRMHVLDASIGLDELPFGEAHNYLNAMAAILLAKGAVGDRVGTQDLLDGLKAFTGLRHRMERVGEKAGVDVINNSMCTNPAAVVASSSSLSQRQHLLIGGINKDMDFAPLKEYLDGSKHVAYLFGSDASEINRQLGGKWSVYSTMAEAFASAVSVAKSGEAVMLAPGAASTDQFKDFRDRGDTFIQIAKEWLESC